MKRKVLPILLSLALGFAAVPSSAYVYAEEESEIAETSVPEETEAGEEAVVTEIEVEETEDAAAETATEETEFVPVSITDEESEEPVKYISSQNIEVQKHFADEFRKQVMVNSNEEYWGYISLPDDTTMIPKLGYSFDRNVYAYSYFYDYDTDEYEETSYNVAITNVELQNDASTPNAFELDFDINRDYYEINCNRVGRATVTLTYDVPDELVNCGYTGTYTFTVYGNPADAYVDLISENGYSDLVPGMSITVTADPYVNFAEGEAKQPYYLEWDFDIDEELEPYVTVSQSVSDESVVTIKVSEDTPDDALYNWVGVSVSVILEDGTNIGGNMSQIFVTDSFCQLISSGHDEKLKSSGTETVTFTLCQFNREHPEGLALDNVDFDFGDVFYGNISTNMTSSSDHADVTVYRRDSDYAYFSVMATAEIDGQEEHFNTDIYYATIMNYLTVGAYKPDEAVWYYEGDDVVFDIYENDLRGIPYEMTISPANSDDTTLDFTKVDNSYGATITISNEEIEKYREDDSESIWLRIDAQADIETEPFYFCVRCLKHTKVTRVAGATRYDTAIESAELLKNGKFETIVLANADNFPDALAAGPLAVGEDAPILLVGKSQTGTRATLDYIKENLENGGKVLIIGGTAAVSTAVEDELTTQGFAVKRLAGANRYETNCKIIEEMNVYKGTPIVVVQGTTTYKTAADAKAKKNPQGYADSLSISGVAGYYGMPIFLSGSNGLTDEQMALVDEIEPSVIYIIGGTAAVSQSIEDKLEEYADTIDAWTERIAGSNRYETSVMIAEYFDMFYNSQNVVLAYGQNFPDGLTGGVLAANLGASVVLVEASKTALQKEYFDDEDYCSITQYYVMGGTAAISDETIQKVISVR